MYAVSKTSFNEVKAKAVKRVSTRALHPSLATAHIFLNTNSNTRKRANTLHGPEEQPRTRGRSEFLFP